MFIYNFKINGGLALKIIIVVLSLFMLGVFAISVYKIFFTSGKFLVKDKIEPNEITEIKADNYSNILQAVHDDTDSYLGMKIRITGYVYRVLDFNDEQFVIARDMYINDSETQTVVIGFLSEYKKIKDFQDGTWVIATGIIEKGMYHNEEIPVVKITDLQETSEPENRFVNPPSDTYIPTSGIF